MYKVLSLVSWFLTLFSLYLMLELVLDVDESWFLFKIDLYQLFSASLLGVEEHFALLFVLKWFGDHEW